MSLQVTGAAEALVAHLTLVWFLSCVHQVMFLQVGELCETLFAQVALEWSFATVNSQVHFKIGELSESLHTDIAFIFDLPVLLFQWIRERFIPRNHGWRG